MSTPGAIPLIAAILLVACSPGTVERKDILGNAEKLYSQYDEELIIRDFFQDRKGGFFLDVGCAFPVRYSTTYYLEKHLGWAGFGVDALPDYAEAWKQKRPNASYFNFLVSDHSGTMESFYRSLARPLSSTQKDRVIMKRTLGQKEIQVPTITLDKLLGDNGITKIDFLSMDIEESEPAALRGFDIERFQPELVCIEASASIQTEITEYFENHGYERIDRYLERDPVNWYYTPKK